MKKIIGKVLEFSYSQPQRIDYSPKIPLIHPFEFPGASDFISRKQKARLSADTPPPITWPKGKTFHEAFFPDNPPPYIGPSRNNSIGLMGCYLPGHRKPIDVSLFHKPNTYYITTATRKEL